MQLQKTEMIRSLREACEEANQHTPIFLIVNGGQINVHQTVGELQRAFLEYQSQRLHYMSLGKG